MHQLMTIPEVARELRVSKMTVYRLIETGEIPAYRIGRSLRVEKGALETYLELCRVIEQ